MSANAKGHGNRPIRVIAIFAHPDDGDVKMGGTAARFAQMGHAVKFVSLTNGDAGHHLEGGGPLAARRREEARQAGERLGIQEYSVLDNHDAELLPSLHLRHRVIREIREWKADIVIGLRPNDYHPDHRYAGTLVMDAAFLVVVPNVTPDVPALDQNPVFLYMEDGFKKPNPFSPDISVGIDDTFDKKLDAMDAHSSQFYEWLPKISDITSDVPEDPEERRRWLEQWLDSWNSSMDFLSDQIRQSLERWYGAEQAGKIEQSESFEIAEYGRQPSKTEIRRLFPMLGK